MFIYKGKFEIVPSRGVVYFHDDKTGRTVLRVCGLDRNRLFKMKGDDLSSIDVTNRVGSHINLSDDDICGTMQDPLTTELKDIIKEVRALKYARTFDTIEQKADSVIDRLEKLCQ